MGGNARPWNSSPALISPPRTHLIVWIHIRDTVCASSHRQIDGVVIDGALHEACDGWNACDLCGGGGGKRPVEFFREIWRHTSAARRSSLRGSAQMIRCDLLGARLTITVYYPLCLLCSPSRALAWIIIRWLLMENVYCSSQRLCFLLGS